MNPPLLAAVVGSVTGWSGHLGDIELNPDDGRVYGSLEYKAADSFYAAVFDVDSITRQEMDAESDGVLTTVYLREVVDDFTATVAGGDGMPARKHRHGCSGIDGVAFGPRPGIPAGLYDPGSGIHGWDFTADVGFEALGGGYFYVSAHTEGEEAGRVGNSSILRLHRWTGSAPAPFGPVTGS